METAVKVLAIMGAVSLELEGRLIQEIFWSIQVPLSHTATNITASPSDMAQSETEID